MAKINDYYWIPKNLVIQDAQNLKKRNTQEFHDLFQMTRFKLETIIRYVAWQSSSRFME